MMEYIKLFWEDAPEGEPSVILYEVDTENERLALHSIDIFADGRTRNIPDLYDGAIEINQILTAKPVHRFCSATATPLQCYCKRCAVGLQ